VFFPVFRNFDQNREHDGAAAGARVAFARTFQGLSITDVLEEAVCDFEVRFIMLCMSHP
jgi:hypothetical protein